MENLLIYLLKSAAILSIFFLIHRLLLSNEPGFSANRKFLIGGILGAFLLPSVEFTRNISLPETVLKTNYSESLNPVASNASSFEIWDLLGFIYIGVLSILLLQFTIQLLSVVRLVAWAKPVKNGEFHYIETQQNISPFSFFQFIVYNPKLYSPKEIQLMLCHEKIHARQWHSADILLAQLTTCILWFNPLSWFYKKAITQNLEFIADEATIIASGEKKTYQQTLVKAAVTQMPPALTNNFYQSFIKKRILMLNKSNKNPQKTWKMSLIFPLILAFLLSFNVQTEARVIPSERETAENPENASKQLLAAYFSENTTKKDLENYKNHFAENNVELEWQDVSFKGGKLKTLHWKYTLETGDSKTFKSENDENGKFVPFTLHIELQRNGKVVSIRLLPETKLEKKQVDKKEVEEEKTNNLPDYIIYKINDKEVSKSKVDALDPNEIESVNVLKGKKVAAETDKKVDGIIEIKLKEKESQNPKSTGAIKSEAHKVKNTLSKDQEAVVAVKRDFTIHEEQLFAKDAEDIIGVGQTSKTSKNLSSHKVSFPAPPLIVVNDKEQSANFNMDEIDPENIASVNVIKGPSAVEKYGEKAKGGVIEVTTKD